MDLSALETQFEIQALRNQFLLDAVNCVRKDILHLEEDENKRLGGSSANTTKGLLEVKIGELRAASIKCHDIQRALIDDAEQLKEFRVRQVDGQFEGQLEKCIGQEKAANRVRCENTKAKLRIEQDHGTLMTKSLRDLTKTMSIIKVLNFKAGASSGDHVSLINYVEERLKGKQKDFERLDKQRARIEKLKESMGERGRMPDDLSSIASSDVDSASESDSETTQLSKMLQENIALTLENQKLEDEVKFTSAKKRQLADTIASTKERVMALQEKLDVQNFVKEEKRSLEESLQEVKAEIAKCATDRAALQIEVEQNNTQIQKLKDEITALEKQTQGKNIDEKVIREVRESEEALDEHRQQLEINMQKIEDKLKENNNLKQRNKEMSVELEQLRQKNSETEKQLKEASDKNEEEFNNLTLKVKQLNKDIQNKAENIKNMNESSVKLDMEIEECSGIVSYLKENLESLRHQKVAMETEMSNIKADIVKTEKNLTPKKVEEDQLDQKIADLEVKLREKKQERDVMAGHVNQLKQENQVARDILKEVKDLSEKAKKEQEEASAGIFSWLPSWRSSSSKQEPSP